MKEIKIGSFHEIEKVVSEDMLANHVGSGEVEVLATPMMIAFMEECAVALLKDYMEDKETTVGIMMNTTHDAATPCGMRVNIRVEVLEVKGKKITFHIVAKDEKDTIATATHSRFLVIKDKFEERTKNK